MKTLLVLLLILPFVVKAQKFYIMEIDKPIYNSLKNRISYLGFNVTEDKGEADFITELVYEKKKGYMSFKSGYNKVGFIRFTDIDGQEVAKTEEQGGIARGYNTYSALRSLFKKIMKNDFDSTINMVAKGYKAGPKHATAATASKADEIGKLKKLMDDGALTKDEFETQKKKILSE